jgi:hypothetical protein
MSTYAGQDITGWGMIYLVLNFFCEYTRSRLGKRPSTGQVTAKRSSPRYLSEKAILTLGYRWLNNGIVMCQATYCIVEGKTLPKYRIYEDGIFSHNGLVESAPHSDSRDRASPQRHSIKQRRLPVQPFSAFQSGH